MIITSRRWNRSNHTLPNLFSTTGETSQSHCCLLALRMTFRQNGCRKNGDGRCERAAVLCVAWFTSAKENKYSLKKSLWKVYLWELEQTNKQRKRVSLKDISCSWSSTARTAAWIKNDFEVGLVCVCVCVCATCGYQRHFTHYVEWSLEFGCHYVDVNLLFKIVHY